MKKVVTEYRKRTLVQQNSEYVRKAFTRFMLDAQASRTISQNEWMSQWRMEHDTTGAAEEVAHLEHLAKQLVAGLRGYRNSLLLKARKDARGPKGEE